MGSVENCRQSDAVHLNGKLESGLGPGLLLIHVVLDQRISRNQAQVPV